MSDSLSINASIGLGNILALVISFAKFHSLGWAIVHGFFGWLYVIYYLCGLSN